MIIPTKTSSGSYDIIVGRGKINSAGQHLNLSRKVMIVTDTGVPRQYVESIAKSSKTPVIHTFEMGEGSKTFETYQSILSHMIKENFTRTDAVVAVGGGVVGDVAGFVASTFMRGIDFYNVPTTLLSQVDSSIGGKTAVDFMGIKNIVGAFYPPKCVIVDPDTLETLEPRQFSNGMAEAIKMAATCDGELFEFIEKCDASDKESIDFIITRSLLIKKRVVEEDEREGGLRRVLNFGHTLAHAIESAGEFSSLYHGECVGLGMLSMCDKSVRERLLSVLEKFSLPTRFSFDKEVLISSARHDKKLAGEDIFLVFVKEIGTFEFRRVAFCEFEEMIRKGE